MKYMLMIIDDEKAAAAMAPNDFEKVVAEHVAQHVAVGRALREQGKWVWANRLRPSAEASTIRVRDGRQMVSDGPFAEAREVLGGYYLIDVDSKDEAIDWASKLPLADAGAIEVRPARTGATWSAATRRGKPFMVMFIANADRQQPREEVFRAIDSHYELSLDLAAEGKFICSRALEPPSAASTLRKRDGRLVITDGPFAESKEFVAGFFVIACESKDEAVEWAKRLMYGSDACEVRPVWEMR
jgi:hypothetical protein